MGKAPFLLLLLFAVLSCKKDASTGKDIAGAPFNSTSVNVNGNTSGLEFKGSTITPVIKLLFSTPIDQLSAKSILLIAEKNNSSILLDLTFEKNDSMVVVRPSSPLNFLSAYSLTIPKSLKSKTGGNLANQMTLKLSTAIDSTSKFYNITEDALLTLVQRQTFSYFWDFGHPVSGLARERNTSGDIVTTGGSGFGMMAIPIAVNRNFISKSEGLSRVQKMVDFLKNKAQRFHGAFPHWLNGATGVVQPFSPNDDGADLVETSYLMMGLLTLRQYFNSTSPEETTLRNDINLLWDSVEWDFFTRDSSNRLFWHWSPGKGWIMNMPIQGWNECLITYVLAASSKTHAISKIVYDNGFARNGAMKNNNLYYGYQLPLGDALGGPLFYEQYSFMGINPKGLSDSYADYWKQAVNHTKINFEYCKQNPKKYYGYSADSWGLTASDIQGGYTASSPTNDVGVIAPTAAISSLPFTPKESLQALKFYYYQLGDKLWGQYGFSDAFSLDKGWFADSYLAIDQGPQIGMIENYRTGLLWNLFMSCPEIKAGLNTLSISSLP